MENTFILDSSVVIEILRGNADIRDGVKEITEGGDVAITAISKYEILMGIRGKDQRKILDLIPCLEFTCKTASVARDLAAKLKESGLPASLPDTLIAAKAKELNATLITRDRDFQRFVPIGVKVIIL